MKNLLDIDDQIERNEKHLEFYYSNYQKTQAKIAILALIYSVISIYIIQVIKYPFENLGTVDATIISFLIFLFSFLTYLIRSIINTYKLLNPEKVAYMNFPKFFYQDIKERYEKELKSTDEEEINAYVKVTYLKELEVAVESNSELFKKKGGYYYNAFRNGLVALIIYVICIGFVVFKEKKEEVSRTNINNFKEIIEHYDSLNND